MILCYERQLTLAGDHCSSPLRIHPALRLVCSNGQHYGEELKESEEQKAEGMIQAMMRRQRWKEEELRRRRKGDKVKVKMAGKLRKETTMSWAWIAGRLGMGHWRTAANAVRAASERSQR